RVVPVGNEIIPLLHAVQSITGGHRINHLHNYQDSAVVACPASGPRSPRDFSDFAAARPE
ncbi:MAG: hypothetical protein M3Y27_31540, partial [Acidobacteriota bacterium]|nr:hypothetical protein [Acidobacteriota bacterium]